MIEPSIPMKPLYWTRIQLQKLRPTNKFKIENCLWNKLQDLEIDSSEFEILFSKKVLTKKKALSETYETKRKTKKVAKLLESKRSQAVGILMSSLHVEMSDIEGAVLNLDTSVLDLENLEALYEIRPQADELQLIQKHCKKKPDVSLDKPEQFLYELSQIPCFEDRVYCLTFQEIFKDSLQDIASRVRNLNEIATVLLKSSEIENIFGIILTFGNYMNGGNRTRGQADGFGLEILPKLKDVKSSDDQATLLHYIVAYYIKKFDEHAGTEHTHLPVPEPSKIDKATLVKFDDVDKDLRRIIRDLRACDERVQRVVEKSAEEHLQPFKDNLENFVTSAKLEAQNQEELIENAKQTFDSLVNYYCVKPKQGEDTVTPHYLFNLWAPFCRDFKDIWKKEQQRIAKQKVKEAHEKVKKIKEDKQKETLIVKGVKKAGGLKAKLAAKNFNKDSSSK
ncbi:formin-like [Anneissia japonica]|uniref:formin-like n=1 Tax=Anneissia japonica TaxID=1529436 RepID=UPI001425624D|nr:formin-like [Anneissia japonica]